MRSTTAVTAPDGVRIITHRHLPDAGSARAALLIVHGMAEHARRYDRFASSLVAAGFAVYAHDQRGHGETAAHAAGLGHLADEDGWQRLIDDVDGVRGLIRHDLGADVPIVLFGHSMGSFVAREYAIQHSDRIAALVLSGTGDDPGVLGAAGRLLARAESRMRGGRRPSPTLTSMSFGGFNKAFAPNRTDFDWLSRDTAEVDAYVADPFCGFVCTSGFFADLLGGLSGLSVQARVDAVRDDLPVLVIAGDADPVGKDGKGPRQARAQYLRAGLRDVSLKLYPGARHEILNETNRDEVTSDVLSWLESRVPALG